MTTPNRLKPDGFWDGVPAALCRPTASFVAFVDNIDCGIGVSIQAAPDPLLLITPQQGDTRSHPGQKCSLVGEMVAWIHSVCDIANCSISHRRFSRAAFSYS